MLEEIGIDIDELNISLSLKASDVDTITLGTKQVCEDKTKKRKL